MRKYLLIIPMFVFLLTVANVQISQAQSTEDTQVEMADQMRADGKIYVVVLVVLIAFSGLMIFAVSTDRKLAKLEKEIKSLKSGEDL